MSENSIAEGAARLLASGEEIVRAFATAKAA